MKRIAMILLAVLLVAWSGVAAMAMEGEYSWQGHLIEVTKVVESIMSTDGIENEDEYAVTVYMAIAEALWRDDALCDALSDQTKLADADGTTYASQISVKGMFEPTYLFFFTIPKDAPFKELSLTFEDEAPLEAAAPSDEKPESDAHSAPSFVLGGIRYTISALQDEPDYQIPNRMDGKEGHVVVFSYQGSGSDAEEANKMLYSGARLRQPNGDLVYPYSNSDNIGNPYELYFGLSGDVFLGDCVFTIADDEGEVEIPLSSLQTTASEPITEPAMDDEPKEMPTAAPDVAVTDAYGEVERKIAEVLTECAQDTTDEWQLAIYRAGMRDVLADPEKEGVYTFTLRSFDPGLKELKQYREENKHDYLNRMLENTQAYELEVSLTLEEGEFTSKSVKALQSAVKKAAAASKKAFADKKMLVAIAETLFYDSFGTGIKSADDLLNLSSDYQDWSVSHSDILRDLDAEQWTPFLFGQVKQALDVSEGPHALVLNCTTVNLAELLEVAQADALSQIASMEYDDRWEDSVIEEEFLLALADNVLSMKKKTKSQETVIISLNVDAEPFYGEEYTEMLDAYAFEIALDDLISMAEELSPYVAREFPKSGWLSGSQSGTKVQIKAPKESVSYYVQLREYTSDELIVAGFVRSGSTCSLRVPKGDYYFVMASGSVWYGEENLFGSETEYSKTGLFEVKNSNYYHTVTLAVTEGGNMPLYDADEDDLR